MHASLRSKFDRISRDPYASPRYSFIRCLLGGGSLHNQYCFQHFPLRQQPSGCPIADYFVPFDPEALSSRPEHTHQTLLQAHVEATAASFQKEELWKAKAKPSGHITEDISQCVRFQYLCECRHLLIQILSTGAWATKVYEQKHIHYPNGGTSYSTFMFRQIYCRKVWHWECKFAISRIWLMSVSCGVSPKYQRMTGNRSSTVV